MQARQELTIAADTRLLLGPGGAACGVLASDQFVALRVSEIQEEDTAETIRAAMQRYGTVMEVGPLYNLVKGGGGPRWARVIFDTAEGAAKALAHSQDMQPWQLKIWKAQADEHTFIQVSMYALHEPGWIEIQLLQLHYVP
jgi:hypothetical protein